MIRKPWLSAPVTPQHSALAATSFGSLKTSFSFLVNLTPDDKSSCLKVGNPQLGMLDQVKRICNQHPDVMPRYHDIADFNNRVQTVDELMVIRGHCISMLEAVESSLTGASDDAFRMALDYYYALKRASKSSMPGLRGAYREVRDNFIHSTGQAPEESFPEVTVDEVQVPAVGPK